MRIFIYIVFTSVLSYGFVDQVTGYKNIKFGISQQELQAIYPCKYVNDDSDPVMKIKTCSTFYFDGHNRTAGFAFIDNKLSRINIATGNSMEGAAILLSGLKKKYGMPTYKPPISIDDFQLEKSDQFDVGWREKQVLLRIIRGTLSGELTVMVVYSIRGFEELVIKRQGEKMSKIL